MLHMDVVTNEPQFASLKSAWGHLLVASGCGNLFSTFEWLSTWWQCFGSGKQLSILVAYEGDRVVAIAPCTIGWRDGFRQATLMGGRVSDYKDLIVAPDTDRFAVLRAILDQLLAQRNVDMVQFSGLPEDSPNLQPLVSILSDYRAYRPAFQESDVSLYVKVEGTMDDYMHTLGKSFTKDCRRQVERLRRLGNGFSFQFATTPEEIEQDVDVLLRQKVDRWHQTKHASTLIENKAVRGFYQTVAQQLYAAGWLQLPVLLVNDRIAALGFGAEYGGKYYSCQTSFDEEFATYSVGRLLNLEIIRRSYENGWREMDHGLGAESYKYDFKPRVRKLFSLSLYQTGVRGRAAEKWFQWLRPRIEHLARGQSFVKSAQTWLKSRRV